MADKNFLELQTQLADIEDQLQMARRYYNGTIGLILLTFYCHAESNLHFNQRCSSRVKGTIRAVHVKLQNGGAVEGDIFHKSLSIDEDSLFEGSSRRVRIQRTYRRALTPKLRIYVLPHRRSKGTPNTEARLRSGAPFT
jgi:hypothetical protein